MKLKIINSRAFKYEGQCNPQERFFEVFANGRVEVDVNPEIGNAVPCKVWHGEIRRYTIPSSYTRKDIETFYSAHRAQFAKVVKGLSIEWNGSNHVGVLSDTATQAEEGIQYDLYSE